MQSKTQVVIVGGGVIGCATAYYLAKSQVKVTVIEPLSIASGASGSSAGILTPYSGSMNPKLLALSAPTLKLHSDLHLSLYDELGVDYGYQLKPHIRCAFSHTGVENLVNWQKERRNEGFETEWLSPDEARRVTGWLTGDILGAVFSEIEPTIDSYLFTHALVNSAKNNGASVIQSKVCGLIKGREGQSLGVFLENGNRIESDVIVLTMGPWAKNANEWLNWDIPVEPQKGQLLHLTETSDRPKLQAAITNFEAGTIIVPKKLAKVIVGSTKEDTGFENGITGSARADIIKSASQVSTVAAHSSIAGQTSCLRPYPNDGMPYVGKVPKWDNIYLATGHWSEGIHFSPLTGKWIADHITVKKSIFDLSALDPARKQ